MAARVIALHFLRFLARHLRQYSGRDLATISGPRRGNLIQPLAAASAISLELFISQSAHPHALHIKPRQIVLPPSVRVQIKLLKRFQAVV